VDVYAMARGVDGDLWIIARETFTPSVVALHRLDSKTFTLTEVGPLNPPVFLDIEGMTVLPDGRILMSAGSGPSAPTGLYELDPATGQSTFIGNTSNPLTALANLDGRVYALFQRGVDYDLYGVDPDTAALTFLHALPDGAIAFQNSMAAGADGRLYVVDGFVVGGPPVYISSTGAIDPVSGDFESLAQVGDALPGVYRGLALIDGPSVVDVPGPGAVGQLVLWTLLLAAGLGFIRFRL
ncbi:MAG: hypothetical protein AAFY88_17655, partial [Acidobacteriota bacterium]